MTTILNPMMADHESRFERLARQVDRIARKGERHNARGNNEGMENIFQNKNHIPNRKNPRMTELMKKEKEKHRIEQKLKSKPFTRKEKVAYVTMESSEEEFVFEAEVDLAELKKGPPYVRSVYPRTGDGSLDFLVQQKIKDRGVSLYLRCNAIFDAEAAAIFEKERMKKELAHREEQARQSQPIRRVECSGSKILQHDVTAPLSRSQAIGVQWIRNCQEFQRRDHLYRCNPQWGHRALSRNQYASYRGRARGYPRGRGGRRSFNQNKKLQIETGKEASKGATPSVHSRIVFPSDGETYPKEILSPAKMEKGKAVAQSSGIDKHKDVDVDEEYFDEGDDDMVGTISIIPTEYLGECKSNPNEDYDQEDEEAFSFIRIEDEPGLFPRPTERQMSHLRPLHIVAVVNGFKINKVLIDGGAAISLLPERMLGKVGKHVDELVPTNIATTDLIAEAHCVKNKCSNELIKDQVSSISKNSIDFTFDFETEMQRYH
ncbi:hypothetical protein Ahy_B02g061549 isoform A [Arachis hypogaea]|uniref:Aspartic peptidase DDI1-type domain-containing protein n=1 Tax=Arachis hypogaea TaxID=3818 RepID=A0A445AL84_ARAHY|nr:hypothetical protein Ahy_B02g061549 isoform A [Arachis hypogaea]